jgi:hypothetical protein
MKLAASTTQFIMIVLLLAACLPSPTPVAPEPTSTRTLPTVTPTATTVWFPPTATFTPLPSATFSTSPTSIALPKFGALILQDDFSQAGPWELGKTSTGSIALGKSELSLGVSQPEGYLQSLNRELILSNFYLEITASPSICREKDEYGLLLRVSAGENFYRFGLNCAGEARFDRILAGQASTPRPPSPYGAIPPGAPSVSQIAIWAVGGDLQFYVNREFLFSLRDPSLLSGGLGVYARAAGQNPMTVNFSDLKIYEALP